MKHALLALFLLNTVAVAQDRPIPAKDAAKAMTVPKGFNVTLFAGEPDVVQPIAMTFDDRGRLWVVECLSYPKWSEKPEGSDRVIVFEDTDGDGQFDKRQVVFDKGANLSGIELGFGGIWLCSIPNLLFVPCDFNADTPKIGKPEAVLDGWSMKCRHNVFNGLAWGPDGWLYGCNGIIDTSFVGKPGTAPKDRTPMNCGVWRYHPTRKVFEPFAHGTTNPWGLDFDEHGEMFITNCVIHHLWHVVPGAHFERMYGEDLNKHVYALMPSIADHLHWGGGHWTTSRGGKGVHDTPGGGHAHSGCMVYLGDNFPDEYRNTVFMCNLHGNRVNRDTLERKGSTYVAKHAPDFLLANDPWHRGLWIKYGPDGAVYLGDWCDTGECHNYDKADVTNGRIFKIAYGKPNDPKGEAPKQDENEPERLIREFRKGDVSKLDDEKVFLLQFHKNEWFSRHARRILQERASQKKLDGRMLRWLDKALTNAPDEREQLRALWGIHAIEALQPEQYLILARHPNPRIAAWALRLFFDEFKGDAELRACEKSEHSHLDKPEYRLAMAAGLQRTGAGRKALLSLLARNGDKDAADPYLPLMVWFASEPIAHSDRAAAAELISSTKLMVVRRFLSRRMAGLGGETGDETVGALVNLLGRSKDEGLCRDVLHGMTDALGGQRQAPMPKGWEAAYSKLVASDSAEVRERAMRLAVLFSDAKAIASMRSTALDAGADAKSRESALHALLSRQTSDLLPLLHKALTDKALRPAAIRGLAAFNDKDTPSILLKQYAEFTTQEKADVIQTLASRPPYASALLDAIEAKQVPRADVDVVTARQIQGMKDKAVVEKLGKVWGQIQPASKERAALTAKYKELLAPEKLKNADAAKGRAVFNTNCATCHRLYDAGGDIGPALTGSQRGNLDYILENVLDPSAVVANEYKMTIINTTSGRTINGVIKAETEKAVTVQTQNEVIVLPKDEIEERKQSNLSMMPEGIFEKLSEVDVRDLVKYLMGKEQVPLREGKKN